MMRHPIPIRRRLKWIGLVVSALTLTVWCLSSYSVLMWALFGGVMLEVGFGLIDFNWALPNELQEVSGWGIERHPDGPDRVRCGQAMLKLLVPSQYASVPFWMVFAAVAIPTFIFWYLDRRRYPLGSCTNCGYNLTGNISGRCPECGAPSV